MQGVTVLVLMFMWCTQTVNTQEGIGLTLNSVQYTNNSVVTIMDIGTGSAALICTSTNLACCLSTDGSHWYFPDGSQVQRTGTTYYRTRTISHVGGGTVVLNRNPGATTTGVFHCDIPDGSGDLQSLYVGIYNATTGFPITTSLRYDNQSRTLTCTSTGGPATTVTWRRDRIVITLNATYQQTKRVVDPVTCTYQTLLTIASSVSQSDIVGYYSCTVENTRGRSSTTVVVGEGVMLSLRGTIYQNNSLMALEDIGEGDDALLCLTDQIACCRRPYTLLPLGNWFFPNGTRVPSINNQWDFHRTRGQMVVRLHRRRGGVTGIYSCVVPDAMNVNQIIYIGVYTTGTGSVVVSSVQFQLTSELNATTPTFTLTCTSTGGPATTVSWTINNHTVTEDGNHHITSQILTDPLTATYTHTLTVTGRLVGEYECTVSNNKPSSSSRMLAVVAADHPSDLTVEQPLREPGSFRVSWTPPASLANLTGYHIYYSGADDSGSMDVGASATDITIDNRTAGVTYTITMVALSPHLPSPVVGPVTVTLGEGVRFSLNGTTYQNNSLVTLEDIGEGVNALTCVTDQPFCCRLPYTSVVGQSALGNWYFPNGTRVLSSGMHWDFHRTRGQMFLQLHRRKGGENGIYQCKIPDATGVTQTIYIGVYTAGTGSPNITSLTFNAHSYTLTCNSTGGPATTVTWKRDGVVITLNATYQQTKRVVNPVAGTYQTVLTIDPSVSQSDIVGTYNCTVENARGETSETVVVPGVWFTLNGTTYQNNSLVTLEDVGEGDYALHCVTDQTACCRRPYALLSLGNWFFPNGTRVPSSGFMWDIHRTRGHMVVFLHHRRGGVTGIYSCVIPDGMNVNQTIYIGVYTASSGSVVVSSLQFQLTSELNATTPTFTLTCTSTGGPATTVSWTVNNHTVTEDSAHHITSQILTDPVTATYNHILTVTGRLVGEYKCNVSNNKPSSSSGMLAVVAADHPSDLTVEQPLREPGSFRVSWTPPASLANLTGYRIYYSGADDSGSMDVGASATDITIDNRITGVTYTITMVALSPHLPSPVVGPVTVTLSEAVRFSLNGITYQNNSLVTLEDIGEGVDALLCVTDQPFCCRLPYTSVVGQTALGNWLFPNGTRVLSSGMHWDFHRTRGQMFLRLHRRKGGENGIYHCVIPDATNVTQTIYIGVYTASTGSPNITSLTFNGQFRTLTCTSTGGPATTVTWRRDEAVITLNATYQQTKRIVDPVAGTYQTVLTIDSSVSQSDIVGTYNCTVENARGETSETVVVPGVWFTLNGTTYQNNSLVTLEDVGEGDYALHCVTDLTACCRYYIGEMGSPLGNWFFPNGTRVPSRNMQWDFYRTRGRMVVRLQKMRGGEDGIYSCVVPDATNVTQTIYIGIYSAASGYVVVSSVQFQLSSELSATTPTFTLTCTSTGSPATTVSWTINNHTVTEDGNHHITSQILTDPLTATYNHTLAVTGRLVGEYECTVSNNKPSSSSGMLAVVAADSPTGLTAEQLPQEPGSFRVSWTPPASSANLTGYRIYYSGANDSGSTDVGASATDITIDNRTAGVTYTITMVALSPHLPSPVIGPVSVTLVSPTTRVWLKPSHPAQSVMLIQSEHTRPPLPTTHIQPEPTSPSPTTHIQPEPTSPSPTTHIQPESTSPSPTTHIQPEPTPPASPTAYIQTPPASPTTYIQTFPPTYLQPEPRPPPPPISHMQPESTSLSPSLTQIQPESTSLSPSLTQIQPESTSLPPSPTQIQPEPTSPAGNNTVIYQLQLNGLPSTCLTWVGSDNSAKLSDIIAAVVQNTERLCQCGFNADYITDSAFQCFPNSDQQVTFRAKLHGTAHATSSQLTEYIQQWINRGTSIAVQGVRINVDICPVVISSFEDPQCSDETIQPDFSSTAAIFGGVVAVVLIVAVTVIIIAALMTKNRKYKYSINQDLRRQPAKWSEVAGSTILTGPCEAYELGQEHEAVHEHDYAVIPARQPMQKQQTQGGDYDDITTQPQVPTLQ